MNNITRCIDSLIAILHGTDVQFFTSSRLHILAQHMRSICTSGAILQPPICLLTRGLGLLHTLPRPFASVSLCQILGEYD